jgi:hypothetical protein
MAMQFDLTLRTNRAQEVVDRLGVNPVLELFTGAQPANCAAADTGTKLASAVLPNPCMTVANGVISKVGSWEDPAADADGLAGHYRLKTSGGTTIIQGTVTATGGGGDMTVANVNFAQGQTFTVTGFSWTEPGV